MGDDAAWEALVERPLGEVLARYFEDDFERGIVATDALIGTFAGLDDESLRQNRCFLYHVIGNGTGDWDVPVGGMGALTEALAGIACAAGAELRLGVEVTVDRDRRRRRPRCASRAGRCTARHVLSQRRARRAGAAAGRAGARPAARGRAAQAQHAAQAAAAAARRVGRPARGVRGDVPRQRVRDPARARLRRRPSAGGCPELAPCEIYCHSLTDPSILGAELREAGAQTLTCFGLHMPARLFAREPAAAKAQAIESTLRVAEQRAGRADRGLPVDRARPASRAWRRARRSSSRPSSACPGGNIFHRDLRGRSPRTRPRWGRGAWRPRTPTCWSAARARGAAAASPASPATTPRRRCSRDEGGSHEEPDVDVKIWFYGDRISCRFGGAGSASMPSTSTTSGGPCRARASGMLLATINSGTLIIALPDLERALGTRASSRSCG